MSDFGTYLRSLRDAKGLSRPQLRDKVRDRFPTAKVFSESTLENMENGKGSPKALDVAMIAETLGADKAEVFSRLLSEQEGDAERELRERLAGEGVRDLDKRTRRGRRETNGSPRREGR